MILYLGRDLQILHNSLDRKGLCESSLIFQGVLQTAGDPGEGSANN